MLLRIADPRRWPDEDQMPALVCERLCQVDGASDVAVVVPLLVACVEDEVSNSAVHHDVVQRCSVNCRYRRHVLHFRRLLFGFLWLRCCTRRWLCCGIWWRRWMNWWRGCTFSGSCKLASHSRVSSRRARVLADLKQVSFWLGKSESVEPESFLYAPSPRSHAFFLVVPRYVLFLPREFKSVLPQRLLCRLGARTHKSRAVSRHLVVMGGPGTMCRSIVAKEIVSLRVDDIQQGDSLRRSSASDKMC
mmetsp:Transcript_58023/g.136271  ORF Transcript_58023/g.136271 Transcript_58023/m.136271 type:complete len:247 (+) Transcript_58023:926-1666(+)